MYRVEAFQLYILYSLHDILFQLRFYYYKNNHQISDSWAKEDHPNGLGQAVIDP